MATHSYHSRKSSSSSSSKKSSGTHSYAERGYSKSSPSKSSSSGPKIISKATGQEVGRMQQKKAAQTARQMEGTHSHQERKASGALDIKPVAPKIVTVAERLEKEYGIPRATGAKVPESTALKLFSNKALRPDEIKQYTQVTGKKYTGGVAEPIGFTQRLALATSKGVAAQRDFLKSGEAKEYIKLKHGLTDSQVNAIYKKQQQARYARASPAAIAAAKAKKAAPKTTYRAPAPKTLKTQAAMRLDIDPKLAKGLTEYEAKTIMGAQSMTIKSDKAREMYKGMLEKRAKGGKPAVVTKEQIGAMDRQAKREQALIKKRNLQEYKPLLDKEGNEIPRFGAVIKDGKLTGTTALKGKGVKGIVSGKYYLSKAEHAKAQKINKAATTKITGRTGALEKRRIQKAREDILKSLPGVKSVEALRYFNKLDTSAPVSAFIPTKQATARVTEKLIQAGIAELAGTKYSEAQKRRIVETKLKRTPISQDLKTDWANLDKKLSKGLNLPTESEIAAHRDRTFGKIPGFTKWQKDFVKKVDANPAAKGFKDFSKGEYERLRNKPATYGAELAAMFIGGAVLGAVTKGGTIITKAGLAKAATRSTRPMVKSGLLKAVKHLDTMVAAGYITPIVAQGIAADWEDKFKLGKGLLVGGAGFAKGAKIVGKRLTIDTSKGPLKEIKDIPKRGIPGEKRLYTKTATKYRKKASGIFTKAEFDRFMRDTKGELVIERVIERTTERVKPERAKTEIEKIKGEISKNEAEIASKERISRQASRVAREKENPAAKEMFKQRAKEAFNEQLELELKNEGLKESLKELEKRAKEVEKEKEVERKRERIKSEIVKKRQSRIRASEIGAVLIAGVEKSVADVQNVISGETKEMIKEKERTAKRDERVIEKEKEKAVSIISKRERERERKTVPEKEKEITPEKEEEITPEKEREKIIEREVERTIEKVRTIEREVEREIEKELEKEREREKEKEREKIKEKEREKIKELPVIPPLPRYRRKPKKPLTKKEKITIDEISRTITNKLGDIKSILG